jgi:hypothetical protein
MELAVDVFLVDLQFFYDVTSGARNARGIFQTQDKTMTGNGEVASAHLELTLDPAQVEFVGLNKSFKLVFSAEKAAGAPSDAPVAQAEMTSADLFVAVGGETVTGATVDTASPALSQDGIADAPVEVPVEVPAEVPVEPAAVVEPPAEAPVEAPAADAPAEAPAEVAVDSVDPAGTDALL